MEHENPENGHYVKNDFGAPKQEMKSKCSPPCDMKPLQGYFEMTPDPGTQRDCNLKSNTSTMGVSQALVLGQETEGPNKLRQSARKFLYDDQPFNYQCSECGRKFSNKSLLNRHLCRHWKKPIIDIYFKETNTEKINHADGLHECQICHKKIRCTGAIEDIVLHLGVAHKYLTRCIDTVPSGSVNPYPYPVCKSYRCLEKGCTNRLFRSKAHAAKHVSIVHCSSTILTIYESSGAGTAKDLQANKTCSICGKEFGTKYDVLRHLHETHKFFKQEEVNLKIGKPLTTGI